ncbi:hypothetical protein [Paraburkholderia sp. Cpub6]|uniref:hypothetical protein n=1 Tax=Paraburkholderia sp. Cpub6 TaxID=2723094 RepID=UPI0016089099|nr:hypothetical protein [Paraburkholderia sp. Cpub6]MBB5460299.1 hypothetical protein [Paraburkholderia sp. Cpub6]
MKASTPCILVTVLAAMSAGLSPNVSCAQALDAQLDCKLSAHDFIAPLLENHDIEPIPMHVEANSINAFRAVHDRKLTAFGFHVYAVLGYAHDDAIFEQGTGQPIDHSAYGAIVRGPNEQVESRAREEGSSAVVHQVIPFLLTAILCDGQ